MKCLTTALVMFMLLIVSQDSLAGGTWTTVSMYSMRSIAVVSDVEAWFSDGNSVLRYDGETRTSFTYEGGFSNKNYVYSIAGSSEGDVWFGTSNGVTRYDGETWTTFDKGEDGLLDGEGPFGSIAVTPGGIVWASISGVGVCRYDGETWTTFTKDDGLGNNDVTSVAVLTNDIILFGSYRYGISIYHGGGWSYVDFNDGLISNYTTSITITQDGVIWVGTIHGVSKHDGEKWISYTFTDGLVSKYGGIFYGSPEYVTSIATGSDGLVWVGTDEGLYCYNGETWTTFNTDDGLANNRIYSLAVSPDNTVWIGTGGLLSRYIPDTGTFVEETDVIPEEIEIISNYPNPFNPETTIEFSLPGESAVDLSIYNITGQKVRTLVSEPMTAGTHSIHWSGTSDSGQALSSGVYISRIIMGNKVASRSMMLMK
ncbi:MAG: T9SS type A sorting domain-containing protein [Candidatus Latescibacteria bacterium]|jgi:hypothetical protein|nr:T9SS type A sorting domain-containing protein [Candidatus Latescibacterota bacterium]